MSEEERTVKRRKIEENRMKKTKHGRASNKVNSSKQLIQLLNGGTSTAIPRKGEIKSEAESSFSDSDVTTSPLDNSSEGYQEIISSNKGVVLSPQSVAHDTRGIL